MPIKQVSGRPTVARCVCLSPLDCYISEGILHTDRGGVEAKKFSDEINRRDFAERD